MKSAAEIDRMIGQISDRCGRISLGHFPTPVKRFFLGGSLGEVWVKQDDQSSEIYGGNKARKLEMLLGRSKRPVLTFGPLGSHHVYATAKHARALGRRCAAVLVPQRMTPHHQEVHRLILEQCDQVVVIDHYFWKSVVPLMGIARHLFGKESFQLCPPGGTNPLGTAGYVIGALELARQVTRGLLPEPTSVYLPLGTGGTAVGVAIGLALGGLNTECVAVRVVPKMTLTERRLRHLVRATGDVIGLALPNGVGAIKLTIENRFNGGYANPTPQAETAVRLGEKLGLSLETTYTGKAMAALMAHRAEHRASGPNLFWQTFAPVCLSPTE